VLSNTYAGVTVIANRENRGFSEATNQGLRQAHGKYILLLNPDTVVLGDALGTMMDAAERDREPAIVGPQIISPEGVPQSCSARKLPTLNIALLRLLGVERIWPGLFRQWTAYPLDCDQPVEAISGACTLAAREVFDAIGPLDAALPMGGEDIDWYRRAMTNGIAIRYVQKAQIIHIGGASRAMALARTDLEGFRALYFYFTKHGSSYVASGYLLVLLLTTIVKSIFLLFYWPFSHDVKHQVVIKLTVCYRIVKWILIRPKN
jgi:GT2 family glycosyltransferase